MRRILQLVISLVLISSLVRGEIGFTDYQSPQHTFSMKYPAAWTPANVKIPTAVLVLKPSEKPNPTIAVSIPTVDSADVALADVKQGTVDQLKKAMPDLAIDTDEQTQIGGEAASHLFVHGHTSTNIDIASDMYLAKHGRQVFSFSLQGASSRVRPLAPAFEQMVATVQFLSPTTTASTQPAWENFVSKDQSYTVQYPTQWRHINPNQMGGADLMLTPDKDPVHTRFTIAHHVGDPGEKAPTKKELEQMAIGHLKKLDPSTAVDSDEETKLDLRPARKLSIVSHSPDGTPMIMHAVFCFHDQQSYVITIAGPTSAKDQFLPDFEKIIATFVFAK